LKVQPIRTGEFFSWRIVAYSICSITLSVPRWAAFSIALMPSVSG
jgi:hypothetical protein